MKDRTGRTLQPHEIVKKSANRLYHIALELEVYLLHLIGFIPLHHVRRFFYRVKGVRIGKGSTIHMGTRFYEPKNISIGNDTIIGENAVLDGRAPLKIGNHVAIATDVMIYNAEHDIETEHFDPIFEEVIIEDYVFIGPRAILLPGITIGRGAVVGAGAVVTKSVSPNTVVGGVPAKEIGKRKREDFSYKLGRAAWFR